tara:strand:- start:487 stop:684 length:198 start_codon:yes stop_codon:yes gene_type:complete
MFNPGDLVGLMISGGWGESVLSETRGVVISCDLNSHVATVVWSDAHQGTEFFEDLKLIAYGRKND